MTTTTNGGTAATGNKPLAIIALALALAFSPMPQTAHAHHCGSNGIHLPEGGCVQLPNPNPPSPPRPIEIPRIDVEQIQRESEKAVLPWVIGGAVVIGVLWFVLDDDFSASAYAPDGSLIPQGWQFTDELGGIGMSRFLGERTQMTFATDMPNGRDIKQLRAEIKFSF